MVIEYIRYQVPAERHQEFLDAYRSAHHELRASTHCVRYEVSQGIEEPDNFIVRIEWDSLEGHEKGFRTSAEFAPFFAKVKPFFSNIREMKHLSTEIGAHMHPQTQTLIDLENRFWQSIVDNETDVALALLTEPSIVVGPRGAAQLRHEDYRRIVEDGTDSLKSFELSNVQVSFPNDVTALVTYHARLTKAPRASDGDANTLEVNDSSTWLRSDSGWKCVLHTETPAGG